MNKDDLLKNIDVSKMTPELLETIRKISPPLAATWDKAIHKERESIPGFITVDPDMLQLKKTVARLKKPDDPVLIMGETGTGKELIAQALHGERTGKFVAINCAGLPANLIESELFGHTSGAFTDAKKSRDGLMEVAKNGTLFLDEIAELDISVQPKLLRALNQKTIRKVGGHDEIPINCRIVCATHRNIKKMVEEGTFREDLYYRISTFELYVKPLIDRLEDVPLICAELDKEQNLLEDFMDEFLSEVIKHPDVFLKGNVRQLQQLVRRYHVLNEIPKLKLC